MNKELKYHGHSANPSDYESADEELAVSMDLYPENGGLRPVLPPKLILNLSPGQKILYNHKSTAFAGSHYIGYDSNSNTLFWIDSTGLRQDMPSTGLQPGSLKSITAIGNTLTVLTDSGMRYYLWKDGSYSYLGMHMPELDISFGLQGYTPEVTDEFTFDLSRIYVRDEEFSEDDKIIATNAVLANVNKKIMEHSKKGLFVFPFFIRYAYRLYDGTLTMHSAPVLMVTTTGTIPYVKLLGTQESKELYTYSARVHLPDFYLNYVVNESKSIKEWGDIIKSIDFFVSEQIYTYDQNGYVTKFTVIPNPDTNYTICRDRRGDRPPFAYEKRRMSEIMNLGDSILDRYIFQLPSAGNVQEKIKSISNFFYLQSVKIEDITEGEYKVIDVSTDYLPSLVNREAMDDDYDSHDVLIPGYSFVYNSRLNLANIKKNVFAGFPSSSAFLLNNTNYSDSSLSKWTLQYYIFLRKNGKEIIKHNNRCPYDWFASGDDETGSAFYYFYYPDPAAYKVVFELYKGTTVWQYVKNLEPHSMLNGAFFYQEDGNPFTEEYKEPIYYKEELVEFPNKIYTSEVNNPFKFPVTNINTVGLGTIIALSTAARALSQGQFGQFPLYAFTTDGVWAMEVSSTGGFSAKQPITRDVCISEESVTQIDDSVLFATDRGVMVISGSETVCLSEVIDDNGRESFTLDLLPQCSKILFNGTSDPSFDFVPFRKFLYGCRMLYDYVSTRIILFNPERRYAYIYSFSEKAWGMMRSSIASAVNSYPECLAMTDDNRLVDYSFRGVNTVPSNQIIITRPIKLDAPDILKTINDIIQRGQFAKGHVKVLLYGSRDLSLWIPISSSTDHYLRGFSGTPYKYFRLVLKCSLGDKENITGCSIQFEPKETNQLR